MDFTYILTHTNQCFMNFIDSSSSSVTLPDINCVPNKNTDQLKINILQNQLSK